LSDKLEVAQGNGIPLRPITL